MHKYDFSNTNQDECGASRFVWTSAKAFTEKGSDKAGVASHFNTFLDDKKHKNVLSTFRGHWVNMFQDVAATYHHLNDKEFLTKTNEPNHLLQSIIFDMNEKVYVSGIRALGILNKPIIQPFWTIPMHKRSVLDLGQHLWQMQLCMEKQTKDTSLLLTDESCFQNLDIVYDLSEVDAEMIAYTEMASKLLFGLLLLVL